MGTVAAIGERVRVGALALAGVDVHVAEQPEEVLRAWHALPAAVALVIVTPGAAQVLGPAWEGEQEQGRPLTVVMPP
jgi:vacuolar-type H+-ATPase subunit F/Vma7